MKPRILRRSKTVFAHQNDALADVMAQQNLQESDLTAKHTKTHWIWTTTTPKSEPQGNGKEFRCLRQNMSEKAARQAAISNLQTFEGNLLDVSTETHFIYKKVRD